MNFENLHKLFTREDSTNIHKILGSISLFNYIYRFGSLFLYGNMFNDNLNALYLIGIHGLLSVSSLIFHIPRIRNKVGPMIYPEFRLHSIAFALRSVFCCFLYYYNFSKIYHIYVCFLTMIGADIITYYYKDGNTMRNMPFDENISFEDQNKITLMHSKSQIAATIFMIGNITTAYSPLFAIQIAAFLMTLVRKNIIKSNTWHKIYTLSLWINIFSYISIDIGWIIIQMSLYYLFIEMRFNYKMNKYKAWSLIFNAYLLIEKSNIINIINYFFYNYGLENIFKFLVISIYLISCFIYSKVLFLY
jgi:hypothetical protein